MEGSEDAEGVRGVLLDARYCRVSVFSLLYCSNQRNLHHHTGP